jgi:hypothetical protein
VRFLFPPQTPAWGGIFTRFEDVDGNSFGLAGFDELTAGGSMFSLPFTEAGRRKPEARRIMTEVLP